MFVYASSHPSDVDCPRVRSLAETEQSSGTGAPALSQPQPSHEQPGMTSDPSASELSTAKSDSLLPSGKNKRELVSDYSTLTYYSRHFQLL